MSEKNISMFQFQIGAIKSAKAKAVCGGDNRFQFQIGAIKSGNATLTAN